MFGIYKTVVQPTVVDDAVYCEFLSPFDTNLITAGGNKLQVYRVHGDSTGVGSGNGGKRTAKLEFVRSFYLYANINSIASCRYGSMTKDALIISFADARVSVVAYDQATADLVTVSAHYFEDEMEDEGIHFNVHRPILKVDPNMRCAVMLIYGCKLVVLSFLEEMANGGAAGGRGGDVGRTGSSHDSRLVNQNAFVKSDPDQPTPDAAKPTNGAATTTTTTITSSSLKSYVIDLRKLDKWLETRIIDIEFLFGYYEPTLFILCESTRTWVGRYSIKKDTCNSVALSINLQQKTHPIIWPVEKLPSDSFKCLAVPLTIGGVLIFSVNSLIYINQSVPAFGVALNSLTKSISNYPLKSMESLKLTLDCARPLFVAPDRLMMSLKNGEIYMVTLVTDLESSRTVRNMYFEKGPNCVVASCLVKCTENYFFVGSRLGDSVLLRCAPKNEDVAMLVDEEASDAATAGPTGTKRIRFSSERASDDDEDGDEDEEADEEAAADVETKEHESEHEAASTGHNDNDLARNLLEMDDETKELSNYAFEVADIVLNIGPCAHSLIGESVGDFSEYSSGSPYYIDLVTSSGYGKHAAISLLQRSLRPEILATFKVADAIDLWTVQTASAVYLFISKPDSTMILQLGQEIIELDRDNSAFATTYPTLHCANLLDNKYIIQVTTRSVNVYAEQDATTGLVCSLELDADRFDSKVKATSSVNNIVAMLTEKGSLHLFVFNESDKSVVELNAEGLKSLGAVACFALFKDESNFFATVHKASSAKKSAAASVAQAPETIGRSSYLFESTDPNDTSQNMSNFDEDALIYGKTDTSIGDLQARLYPGLKSKSDALNTSAGSALNDSFARGSKAANKNANTLYLLLTVSVDGLLTVSWIKTDSVVSCFTVAKFNFLSNVVQLGQAGATATGAPSFMTMASMDATATTTPKAAVTSLKSATEFDQPVVQEISLTAAATSATGDKKRHYMFVRTDDELVIYEMFSVVREKLDENVDKAFYTNNYDEFYSLNEVKLKRLTHDVIVRDKKRKKASLKRLNLQETTKAGDQVDEARSTTTAAAGGEDWTRGKLCPTLKSFSPLADMDGVFLGGANPHVIFFSARSGVVPRPVWVDGPIVAFAPLAADSQIAPNGFIYLSGSSDIRICNLPVEENGGRTPVYYDFPWTLRKVPVKQTVHFICYHEESKTYAVVTSVLEPTNKLMQLGGEDKDVETFERDENFILPQKSQFYIQLYTSNTWEPLPLGKISLNEWEHVSSLKLVSLPYEGHSSGFRSYLAASTVYCYNEDVNSRGKIIIFDVIETVPEPDKPLTCIKVKTILEKEQKGPVTCLESVDGYLIGGVGQKIFIWEYRNSELIGKAFLDTHFYIHKMIALKSFVLIADLHRSISLIRFQNNYTKLSFVAKDKSEIDTYACEYLVDNSNLGFISTDSEKNIYVHMYQNESHDNQGGQWLIRKAEFNAGAHINSMFRLKCKVTDPNQDKRSNLADKRQVTYCSTLDGGIGFLIPISEKTFRRLFVLQNALVVMIPHYAGLNPKSYRAWASKKRELSNPQKNILDGDLLFEFFNLSYTERVEVSKKIKTNPEQLLDDLAEIYQFSAHF